MPCKFCEDEYFITPCKSNGILTKDNLNYERGFLKLDIVDIDQLVEQLSLLFKKQNQCCPCIKCLVKTMCISTTTCEPYTTLLDSIYEEETYGIKGECPDDTQEL